MYITELNNKYLKYLNNIEDNSELAMLILNILYIKKYIKQFEPSAIYILCI